MADISKVTLLNGDTYNLKDANAVPKTRTINGQTLSDDISLTAAGVGALPISGGTLTGALTLNADPTSNMQASTKQYVDTAVSEKQSKATITSTTLSVASWSNGVYSFESTYPNASYNIDVEPDGYTITDSQFKAWNEAKIVGNSNGNTIKALGTVPTVAIPVVVRATPK